MLVDNIGSGPMPEERVWPQRAVRKPCDRWFMKLRDWASGLSGSAEWTKEMIDAVAQGQADNPEARVVLSELHERFLRASVVTAPVRGDGRDAYYGKSAAEFIKGGNPFHVQKRDKVAKDGVEYEVPKEVRIDGCDSKDVPISALRSGFCLDIDGNRDWIKRVFKDLKAGKVSLTDVRAALRDGCLNEIGRYFDFKESGKEYKDYHDPDSLSFDRLHKIRWVLEDGHDVQMYTEFGWPFGVKIPGTSEELPRPVFNLDTIGSKIPGVRGAK